MLCSWVPRKIPFPTNTKRFPRQNRTIQCLLASSTLETSAIPMVNRQKKVENMNCFSVAKKILFTLFPNVKSWINFLWMLMFLLVLFSAEDPIIVLVSVLGLIYCHNEWIKSSIDRSTDRSTYAMNASKTIKCET